MFSSRNFVWVFFKSARATLNRILSMSGRAGSHCSARVAHCCRRLLQLRRPGLSLCWLLSLQSTGWAGGQERRCTGFAALQPVEPSQTRGQTCVPCTGRQILNHWTMRGVLGPLFIVSSSCKYFQLYLLKYSRHNCIKICICYLHCLNSLTIWSCACCFSRCFASSCEYFKITKLLLKDWTIIIQY